MNSLAPFMKEYHQRAGDYLERATGYARQGIRHPFRVTRVVMTDEDSYTCEYCNRKFETIGAWRRHDGRNPRNGEAAGRRGGEGPVSEIIHNLLQQGDQTIGTGREARNPASERVRPRAHRSTEHGKNRRTAMKEYTRGRQSIRHLRSKLLTK